MDGFFTLADAPEEKGKAVASNWTCKRCKLFESATHPQTDPVGNFKKGIMIIGSGRIKNSYDGGDNPILSPTDYFKTDIGRFLKWAFQQHGVSIDDDCIYLNAVNCDTKKNSNITHLGCCREEKVLPAIKKYKPKAIFLLGLDPLTSVVAHRWGNEVGGFNRWRGCKIPDQDFKSWLFPIDDPADIRDNSPAYQLLWRNDILTDLAMNIFDFPSNPLDDMKIDYYYDGNVGKIVKEFCSPHKLISFDYETTGLRPFREGHGIVCASVAYSEKRVMAFMFPEDPTDPSLDGWIDVLRDKNIAKMAHNMNYEELWSRECLGTQVINWKYDTMIAAHILDSRPGFVGLKFQSYINFGVLNYEEGVSEWITDSTSTDGMNSIDKLCETKEGKRKLLKYCAIDSALQFKLAKLQEPIIGIDL